METQRTLPSNDEANVKQGEGTELEERITTMVYG